MWPNPQFPPFFVVQRQFNHICALSNNNNNKNNFASNTTYEKNISNDSNFLTIIYYDIFRKLPWMNDKAKTLF